MVFSCIYRELEHFRGLNGISASISDTKFISFVWEYFALPKISDSNFKVVFCHVSEVPLLQISVSISINAGLRVFFVSKADQNIVAFQVVVSDIMRMDGSKCLQDLVEYRYIETQIFSENFYWTALLASPVTEWTCILFHDDVVRLLVYAIIVKICHTFFKPELLEASYFCKDIVKYTSISDVTGDIHLLDCHWAWVDQISFTLINSSVSPNR